jgi:hypothetical protein
LEELLRLSNFKTGPLDHLQKVTSDAWRTIVKALARLKLHGFFDWVRRSRSTEIDRELGPQQAQTSNACFFEIERLARTVRQRFMQLLGHCERPHGSPRTGQGPAPVTAPTAPSAALPADPGLAAVLARLRAAVDNASS